MTECEGCKELREQLALALKEIAELKKRLAIYENAHTPPSQKRFPERKQHGQEEGGRLGRPPGYEGCTRPTPKPDKTVVVLAKECDECGAGLGEPAGFQSTIVEEIPEPQPIEVTEYQQAYYFCSCCGKLVIAKHSNCPQEGVLGYRTQAQVALLKYKGRLPCKLVCTALERDYGLTITPATVLAVNSRVANALEKDYTAILQRIRSAPVVHADETGFHVGGVNYWLWIFVTENETLVVIRQSRAKKVLREVLGDGFQGIIVCDGHRSYSNFTSRIQRCWAHLLREAKYASEKTSEAKPFYKMLTRLFRKLTSALEGNPSVDERLRLSRNALLTLRRWLAKQWFDAATRKVVEYLRNGLKHWLTFVTIPGVEPTNNRAERALREHVVIRKIIGTLRNREGVRRHEVIMSVFATWYQQTSDEKDVRERLVQTLRES